MAERINTNLAGAVKSPAGMVNTNINRTAHSVAYNYHRPHYHAHNHHAHGHHFCHSCCHPVSKCCCGHKHCRKESKELLVEPQNIRDTKDVANMKASSLNNMRTAGLLFQSLASADATSVGLGTSIIGGGCCVHLSVEYMLEHNNKAPNSLVAVAVEDSEDHTLIWIKDSIQAGYHIKEDIITINPGARLVVVTLNAIARVRWCEVFSC